MEMENMINSVHTMFSAGAKKYIFSTGWSLFQQQRRSKRQQNKLNRIQILMMHP